LEEGDIILTIFSSISVTNNTIDNEQLITFLSRPFVALDDVTRLVNHAIQSFLL
jgi:hypothetical protein